METQVKASPHCDSKSPALLFVGTILPILVPAVSSCINAMRQSTQRQAEPVQRRGCCYLQVPFLKMHVSLISYSVWIHDTVAGMKLASCIVNIYAVPLITLGEIALTFPG